MSLSPGFVPWAAIAGTLVLVTWAVLWLVYPTPLRWLAARLELGDLVAAWLGYGVVYHLWNRVALRMIVGQPLALWLLCGGVGAYLLLRRLPSRSVQDWRFAWAVLVWAGLIAANQGWLEETGQDAARLAERPGTVITTEAPVLRPLWRVALLARVEGETRVATQAVLAALLANRPRSGAAAGAPPDDGQLAVFRHGRVPFLVATYERELAKLRTYYWLQVGLLAVTLLVWGFAPRRL